MTDQLPAAPSSLSEQLADINEYERERVPERAVKGFRSFVGMVAGEHIAGTEFVIGPLFVLHGAGASDVLWGLLLGNILATLSWTLVCAPAAVKTRLTNFFQLEKISGVTLVTVYNLVNGLLYCVAAAAMIGVSASAIGLLLSIEGPGLGDLYPTSIAWVLVVVAIGAVIVVVSTFGFDRVSKFANVFAPWMPLVFLASGIAVLPSLGVTSVSDFWEAAETRIWTGVPAAGQSKYTFWHILVFAWLCNSSMHLGLGDMTIYRYARHRATDWPRRSGCLLGTAWRGSPRASCVPWRSRPATPTRVPGRLRLWGPG